MKNPPSGTLESTGWAIIAHSLIAAPFGTTDRFATYGARE